MIHVDFQTRKEHKIENTYLPEDLETHVARQQVETVGAYGNTGKNKPDNLRNLQSAQQQRRKQNYSHHRKEDGHGLRDEGCGSRYCHKRNHRQKQRQGIDRGTKIRKKSEFTVRENRECSGAGSIGTKKGKLTTSHRYNPLPLLRSRPGGVHGELVV